MSTYNQYGYKDYSQLIDIWDDIYDAAAAQAGVMLLDNLQDQTAKTGLALAGWRPKVDDMEAQAVDWWSWGASPTCLSPHVHTANYHQTQTSKTHTRPSKVPSSSVSLARTSP